MTQPLYRKNNLMYVKELVFKVCTQPMLSIYGMVMNIYDLRNVCSILSTSVLTVADVNIFPWFIALHVHEYSS